MVPTSLIEKLKTIYNIISSNPFFFVALIIVIILLILVAISLKKYKKINIKLFMFVWILITALIIIKYHKFILNLGDSLIENVLMAIYFPNIAIFTIVLIISNVTLFYSIIKKDLNMVYKVMQITSAIIINFLFVLILDTVVANNIDIYSQTEVYQNNELFVLLETSMLIFTINVVLTSMIFIIKKLLKSTNKKTTDNTKVVQSLPPSATLIEQPIQNPNTYSTPVTTVQLNNSIKPFESIMPKTAENINMTNTSFSTNYNNSPSINSTQYTNTGQPFINNLTQPTNNQESILHYSQPIVNNQRITTNTQTQQVNNVSIINQTPISQNANIQSNSQNNK